MESLPPYKFLLEDFAWATNYMETNLIISEAFSDMETDSCEAQLHPALRLALQGTELEQPDIRIHPVIENAEHIPVDDAPGVDARHRDANQEPAMKTPYTPPQRTGNAPSGSTLDFVKVYNDDMDDDDNERTLFPYNGAEDMDHRSEGANSLLPGERFDAAITLSQELA